MIQIIESRGTRETLIKINNLLPLTKRAIHNALYEIGKENVRHVKKLMLERKTGKIYIIEGKPHQASAPGEAPATITRKLLRSVSYSVRGHYEMEFGDTVEYGKFLEQGTSKMEPRPHIEKTVTDKQKDTEKILERYTKYIVFKK